MKTMKKLASLALALILTLALAVPAMAATVTLPTGMDTHTFVAYQIFAGTQDESEGALGDITWGSGIAYDAFLIALKNEATAFTGTVKASEGENVVVSNVFANCKEPAEVAAALAQFSDNSAAALKFAELANTNKTGSGTALTAGTNELADGYYLIVDTTDVSGKDDAANASLLQVTEDITIGVKSDKPELDKVIVNADSANGGDGLGTAQDVGTVVTFKLTSKVPNMTGYTSYTYIVNDSMSTGLTPYDGDDTDTLIDVTVTIGGTNYTDFTVAQDGHSFTITFNNFINQKDNVGKEIIITYKATINEKALGTNVETNTVNLEYSNNPNNSTSKGKTPDKTVYVYDFDIVIDKYANGNEDKKLANAEFVLKNKDGKYYKLENNVVSWVNDQNDATTVTTNTSGIAEFKGLDSGTYQLIETKAPAGYNLLKDPINVEITATYNESDGTLNSSSATSTNSGQYSQTQKIENNAGATLPETGGIGTTIFYAVGGVLVVAAIVLLVTKKRMNREG